MNLCISKVFGSRGGATVNIDDDKCAKMSTFSYIRKLNKLTMNVLYIFTVWTFLLLFM